MAETNKRTPLIAGNWKLHKTVEESLALASALEDRLSSLPSPSHGSSHEGEGVDIVVAPVFTSLYPVAQRLKRIALSAQDLYWEASGAFTGEVSATLLRDVGCSFCIIGHSERRSLFGESDEHVNRKVKSALAASLTPIVCVGESLEEREAGQTLDIVRVQVEQGLKDVKPDEVSSLAIAYEPIWAIGTGKTASATDAQEVHASLRSDISRLFGDPAAQAMRILYGGSVKPGNAAELLARPDIDGALVGGASLDAESFEAIVRAAL